ncbi:hypothetical protein Q3G72_034533 [Acer saccharum]|nr:hypothetical protein Q3G72_034533 [Acer saccharum]
MWWFEKCKSVVQYSEEDTLKKRRLDRGKLLVLFPYESICHEKIKVVEPSRSFELTIVEEASTTDYGWVRRHLGLRSGDHQPVSNSFLASKNWGRWPEKFESQAPSLLAQKIFDNPVGSPRTRFVSREEEVNVFRKSRNVRAQEFKMDVNPYHF